ncbi:Uncharacterised protein [Streptococcus macacae NCTC 11558]|nr:Uncharacterised protein [Streptococcus macacae NCTC 11558]
MPNTFWFIVLILVISGSFSATTYRKNKKNNDKKGT